MALFQGVVLNMDRISLKLLVSKLCSGFAAIRPWSHSGLAESDSLSKDSTSGNVDVGNDLVPSASSWQLSLRKKIWIPRRNSSPSGFSPASRISSRHAFILRISLWVLVRLEFAHLHVRKLFASVQESVVLTNANHLLEHLTRGQAHSRSYVPLRIIYHRRSYAP
ncbi:hypothetical protein BDZ45DRAFT_748780 [Acephala macrosclerotiorum]|nr:hypothetical protein BDZ45DRAFT_748780 [Acephala macrosclerotiorum]